MNRLTAKLAQGVSRLAFWRKPAAAPDPAALAEAPARELADENAIEEAASVPKLSVLERLKTTFRRQTKPGALEADESIPGEGLNRDATAFNEDESGGDEDTAQPGRIRRVLARLSNKWVWIPGASAMLLVLIGTMALMLLQSAQEKEHLQAELLAMQKKLEQTGVAKQVAAGTDVPAPADVPTFAAVGSRPGIDAGDCQVSDQASVSQNLKNCIDSFNRSMAGPR